MSANGKRRQLRGAALEALPLDRCSICTRGREACSYCEHDSDEDWAAICDCGLADFGKHLVECETRKRYRYVIAQSPAEALMPRMLEGRDAL